VPGREEKLVDDIRRSADVVIITALKMELEAVITNSGPWQLVGRHGSAPFPYYWTDAYQGVKIAAVCMLGSGLTQSAITTTQTLDFLAPRRIVLVGVCAGVADKAQLGDICISEQIVDYEGGRVEADGVSRRWEAYQADSALLRELRTSSDDTWAATLTIPRPDGSVETPTIHMGTILSGNKVVADAGYLASLTNTWTQAIGLDMESAGAAAASHAHSKPGVVMIKGVCDRADFSKNDEWQAYAADAAGRFTIAHFIGRASRANLTSEVQTFTPTQRYRFRVGIGGTHNMSELQTMTFDLGVDWEELAGVTKSEKVVALISYMERRKKIEVLKSYLEIECDLRL
jgi:nucleoside phosphorylase